MLQSVTNDANIAYKLTKERLPLLELVIRNSMNPMKQSMYSLWVILSPKSDRLNLPPASST